MAKQEQLASIIAPAVEAVGYVLWGIEYLPQGKHAILRVYIDHEDGITVDDCEVASRQVSAVLDVEDPIKNHYTLEVSSPGLDRPLFTPEQFRFYCGDVIHCRVTPPINHRRKFTGELLSVEDEQIVMKVDNASVIIPFSQMDKAHVVPSFKIGEQS